MTSRSINGPHGSTELYDSETVRVLLIEDSRAFAALVRGLLENAEPSHFELVTVERLVDGLQRLRSERFDVILTDLSLPDAQELEAVVQCVAQAPELPIVVLTASVDETLGARALQAGAQDYLTKEQVTGSAVSRSMRYAVERHRWQREARKSHDELERRVAERTAELAEANRKLQCELEERLRAEESWRMSQFQLSQFWEQSMDGMRITDQDGLVVAVNPAYCRMVAKSAEELVGKPFSLVYAKDDQARLLHRMQERLASHDIGTRFEREMTLWDGRKLWFELTNSCLDSPTSAPLLLSILHDIAERKRAEEALREAEAKYRAIFENAVDGIFQSLPDRSYLSANPALARMLGYDSPEDLMTSVTDTSLNYADCRQYFEFRRRLEEEDWVSGFESLARRKDGTVFWVSRSARAICDASGAVVRYEGTVEDIDERKRAEQALQQAEEKYRGIFDNAILGIFRTTPDGRLLAANRRLAQMWGYESPEELMSSITNVARQLYVNPEQREEFKRLLAEQGIATNFEHTLYRRDGSIMWGASNARAIRDEQGNLLYYDGTLEDITARQQAEESLRQKHEELQAVSHQLLQSAKLATMGELAASIAHELNNPMATVSLRVESLLDGFDEGTPQRRSLEIVMREVERMANLVSSLLHLSRRQQQQISTIEVAEEIDGTLELIHYRLCNHGIELVKEYDVVSPVHADRQQLRQVFLNLFTNAIDAMRERGSGQLTIRVNSDDGETTTDHRVTSSSCPHVVVAVQDTGQGIPPENLTKIMEPFFTTKPEGQGTGLGMAICQRIVQEHGGALEVASEVGKGTTVRVTLPTSGSRLNSRTLEE